MKKISFILLSMLAVSAYAENPTNPTPITPPSPGSDFVVIVIKQPKGPVPKPTHPRMPGYQETLEFNYHNGELTVEFPADAETAVVNIGTGDFAVFSAGIDRGYPCVELPPLSGDFLLSVTFDNGDTYEGEISFN